MTRRNFGHAGTNHHHAPKERDNRGASELTRVLFERIPGTKSFRRVASSYRSKESERPHSCTSLPYVHDKLCAKLRSKRRLRVQNRPAGKYLRFAFESKVYQFQVLPFGLNRAPQVFTRLGHTVTGYLYRQGISVIPYLDDWLIHHPDRQVLLRHQAQLINTLDLVGFILNRKKSELDLTQDLQFLGICLRLDLGEASLPESKAWEIVARARHLSSLRLLTYSQVSQLMGSLNWASGLIPLGRLYPRPLQRHFHSLGLTDRFTPPRRSDPLVLANLHCTSAMAGPTFSYLRNPYPHVSGGPHDFYGRLHARVGRSHGGFPDFGYLDPCRPQAPYQLSGAQSGNLCPTALGSSASGPPGYDRHGQFDSSFIYQQARRDSFPHLAPFDSRFFPLVRGSEHNSPGKAYSRLSERESRPPISSEPAHTNRVVPPPRDHETHLQALGDTRSRHVCDSVELPPSSVHVSNSGAKSPSGGCSAQDWQGRSMYMFPPFPLLNKVIQKLQSTQVAEVVLIASWWPSQL